jgi:hypothetical protein
MTMLAKCPGSILSSWSLEEFLETSKDYSSRIFLPCPLGRSSLTYGK